MNVGGVVAPMMRARLSRGIRGWMALALLSAACTSGGAPLAVPADLPNRTEQSGITFRWALARDPATVRAVGVMEPGSRPVPWATVALFGVDAGGRVVSRGQTDLRGGFGRASLPFEIALRPTGREEQFELVLLHAQEGKPGD
jgi:hypothetical protein